MAAAASSTSASVASAPSPTVNMVSLVPCMHKITKELAKSIYGGTNDQGLVYKPGHCPFSHCKQIVTSYLLDATYSLAIRASEASKAVEAGEKEVAAQKKMYSNPYPWPRDEFRAITQWGLVDPQRFPVGLSIQRYLCFISRKYRDIWRVRIYGYADKSIAVVLTVSSLMSSLFGYLKRIGVSYQSSGNDIIIDNIDNRDNLKILFRALTVNNEFPAECLSLIQSLGQEGHW